MIGQWKSKESGLVVEVIKFNEHAVWYKIEGWRNPQNCALQTFTASMEKLPPLPSKIQNPPSKIPLPCPH